MLLHGLDTTIWLWYHMAMNIWVVHFLVKEKKKKKQGYWCFIPHIHSVHLSHLETIHEIQFLYPLVSPPETIFWQHRSSSR